MDKYQCIVTVTTRGNGAEVIEASKRKGATGGTILSGKGSSVYETKKLFSAFLEPEKEVVIILIEASKASVVMEEIRKAMDIDTPGKGIIFVFDVEDVKGITPLDSLQ